MDSANQNLNNEESTFKENVSNNKPEIEKDLLVWRAPSRPFKTRDRQFYVTTISIASMVCLILFLAEGAMPVILIISLIFLYYVMSTVPPEEIEYKITNKGIKVGNQLTVWDSLGRFWFGKRFDNDLLIFETNSIPNRMELVFKQDLKIEAEKILKEYLVEEEISPSNLDKTIDWYSKKLPQ